MVLDLGMYRVRTITSGWQGAPGYTTHYFRPPDSADLVVSQEDADACVARVLAAWQTAHALWPTTFSFDVQNSVDVIKAKDGELVVTFVSTEGGLDLGTGGSGFGPTVSGMAVNWLTAGIENGHHVRGRSFLVPLAVGGDTNGSPTGTQLTLAASWATGTSTHAGDAPEQVVWHRPKGAADGSAHDITSVDVKDRFCILRSRRG